VGDFRKLQVWQRAQALTVAVYRLTERFPPSERFSLTVQMRRAALSVPSNLAEGCGRRSDLELRRYIRISQGSLAELETQLLTAMQVPLVDSAAAEPVLEEIHTVRGMLHQLHQSLVDRRT
jgi:four helix bundle protein